MFKLDLTEAEVNIILQSLAAQPYSAVVEIINKVRTQCQDQMKKE